MRIILSEEAINVNGVIDWLTYFSPNDSILRLSDLNQKCYLNNIHIGNDLSEVSLKLEDNSVIQIDQVKSVFIKQSLFNISDYSDFENVSHSQIKRQVLSEKESLKTYLSLKINQAHRLGDLLQQNINKLFTLEKAVECGLTIPNTLVTTCKSELLKFFYKNNSRIITKAIQEMPFFVFDDVSYLGFTQIIDVNTLQLFEENFTASLFQECIEKDYELRILYLDENIYTGAIMSQLDEITKIDFRKYNYKQPNRILNYNLPEDIKNKICKLMKSLNLNFGMIDIVASTKGEFFFLEVNPVGQYGWIDEQINSYFEKNIAQFLLSI